MSDLADLLARFDRARGRDDFDGAPTERDGPVVRVDYAHGGFIATPSDTGLRGADLDALIVRQRDAFAARGIPVEWKTYAYDEPADLTTRLVAAGFEPEERETVLVGPVEALGGHPAEVDGVVIRETTDPADFAAIGTLHSEVWGEDWSWIAQDLGDRTARLGPDGFRVFVAEADGRLVSAAWLVMRQGTEFASLWGGSTLEEYRGRGIYRALVARRAALARDAGFGYLQVDASDMSRPILERLGFVALTTTTPYVSQPAAGA
jgi:GNAT superfamily N-acetyltransferase